MKDRQGDGMHRTSSANARAHVVISRHSVRQGQLACVPDVINTI